MKTVEKKPAATKKRGLQDLVSFNLRMMMAARSMNQQDMADVLGVTRPAVSQKFSGKHPWSLDDIEKASEFFNVNPEALVGCGLTGVFRPSKSMPCVFDCR